MELSNLPGEGRARITIRKDVTQEIKKDGYVLEFPCPKCFETVTLNYNGGELDQKTHQECKLTFSLETPLIELVVKGDG